MLGINKYISALAFTSKLITALGALAIILFVGIYFDIEMQGYYYAFVSLAAIKILGELGMSMVMGPTLSHEWAHLSFEERKIIIGPKEHIKRFKEFTKFYFSWNIYTGLLITLILIFTGLIFFKNKGALVESDWIYQWFFFCIALGISQALSPILTVLESSEQIKSSYLIRLIQAIIAPLVAIGIIVQGYGLWACGAQIITEVLILFVIASKKNLNFFAQIFTKNNKIITRINWRIEIFPMQWRIAISWISGYLSFYLFVPISFHYNGPESAGKLGMTLAVANGITALAASIVSPQVPKMASCIALKNYLELKKIYLWCQQITSIVGIGITLIAWSIIKVLNKYEYPIAERFISPTDASMLFAATAILIITLPASSYLRSFKEEPLYLYSLCVGILIGIGAVLGGKYFSNSGILASYLIVMIIQIPLIYNIWKKKSGYLE